MKTIFILTRNFPPLICGVGDYSFQLYEGLKEKGYSVKIITTENDQIKSFILENNLKDDVFPIVQKWRIASIPKIIRVLRSSKADILSVQYVPHSFSRIGLPIFLFPLFIVASFNRLRLHIFFHEVSLRVFGNGWRGFVFGTLQRMVSYMLFISCKMSMTNNILYKKYFKPFSIPVIPVPANLFDSTIGSDGFHALTKSKEIRLSSFINRCSKEVLQAIVACVVDQKQNLTLTIIGEGTAGLRKAVENQVALNNIKDRVIFFDKTSAKDIVHILHTTDIFLNIESVSAKGEGGVSSKSGITSAAMAAGLPIIGSLGDMTDTNLYRNRENILLVDFVTGDAISQAITELSSDNTLREKLKRNALKTYVDHLSWDQTIAAYIAEFENFKSN